VKEYVRERVGDRLVGLNMNEMIRVGDEGVEIE
jgi:hypothetical protein